ncbi:orotate phosphoribosyltransferase [Thalassobacillus pellis]|uniref:orotate phosphoribosyltransferase n=1 Tax=Thalassobacillus pellis TaxID=748008 RepID=UPI00195F2E95|nr:orotate phosphoribosyltransferase [Thalassobacillus pellis]MBM7552821.1 orotate phosphoribosyltransferase [Thalassobacillus pellis]
MSERERISSDLLAIEAVQIRPDDPFTWTSGIKSPIYCDNRLTMSYPDIRGRIRDAFVSHIKELPEKIDIIAGCATAGIPHAAFIAESMGLPMVYVRSSSKKHGKGNQIEGLVKEGDRVVVIEDLISTGKSSINAAKALEGAGAEVVQILAIFSYGLPAAEEAFGAEGFTYNTLTDFSALLDHMKKQQSFDEQTEAKIWEWQRDPASFKG